MATAVRTTLITTKLHRPGVTANLVPRPRLAEMLDRGLSVPLTLVCAPAGFGKTTLVSAWVRDGLIAAGRDSAAASGASAPRPSAAWLSLDESDSDLDTFLRSFIAAVRTQFAGFCAATLDLLSAPEKPAPELVLATLSNELALAPRRFVAVLDDYHAIGGKAVHDLLAGLLRHWPPSMHLVLVSRTNPPLPLARLRANAEIVEIRSRDLRFTATETATFMSKALGPNTALPDQSTLALLEERTEGWAAGLHLAALTLAGADDVNAAAAQLAGEDAGIADYLVDEVLSRQTAEVQEFLLLTSILDRFCARLCEAVLAGQGLEGDVRGRMEWLVRANLFVISLDSQREWYRYHHLFQGLLRRRLIDARGQEKAAELHRLAAAWFGQNRLTDEAVSHALAAQDPDMASEFMEAALCDTLNRDDRPALERWLRLLPEDTIERRPGALMIKAWTLQLSWQPQAQAKVLQQVETLLHEGKEKGAEYSADEASILRGQMLTLYGQAAFFRNENARAVTLCQQGLSLLPSAWMYVRGGNMVYLALAMQANGQGAEAERLLLDFYESLNDKATSYGLRVLMAICFVHLQDGQLDRVRQTAQSMLALAGQPGLVISRCWANYFLGIAHYHRNDLEQAQRHFEAILEMRFISQMLAVRAGFYGLALTQQARGRSGEALQTVQLFSEFDLQTRGAEDARTRSLCARLMLLQGDLEGAAAWADALAEPPPDQPLLWLEEPHLTKVRILLARGNDEDVAAALQLLDTLAEIALRTHNVRFQIEILTLSALAMELDGDSSEALAALQQAVQLARAGGFVRLFIDLGPRMQAMLERLVRRGIEVEPVRRILAAFSRPQLGQQGHETAGTAAGLDTPAAHGDDVHAIERLTMREIDVLMLLRERLSNKEIAAKLSLSTTTVKRHTANIYGKLGVSRRWDAVTRGEALGILPPR